MVVLVLLALSSARPLAYQLPLYDLLRGAGMTEILGPSSDRERALCLISPSCSSISRSPPLMFLHASTLKPDVERKYANQITSINFHHRKSAQSFLRDEHEAREMKLSIFSR
jgi:hypothetical protein